MYVQWVVYFIQNSGTYEDGRLEKDMVWCCSTVSWYFIPNNILFACIYTMYAYDIYPKYSWKPLGFPHFLCNHSCEMSLCDSFTLHRFQRTLRDLKKSQPFRLSRFDDGSYWYVQWTRIDTNNIYIHIIYVAIYIYSYIFLAIYIYVYICKRCTCTLYMSQTVDSNNGLRARHAPDGQRHVSVLVSL